MGDTNVDATAFADQKGAANLAAPPKKGVLNLLTQQKSTLDHAKDFGRGIKDGAVETGKGLKNMAVGAWKMTAGFAYDPKEAKATWSKVGDTVKVVADNPKAVLTAIAEPYKTAWQEGRPGEAIGRGTFEAAALLLGSKGLDKLTKLAKGAKAAHLVAGSADDVARAGSAAQNVAKVAKAAKAAKIVKKAGGFSDDAVKAVANKADDVASAGKVARKTAGLSDDAAKAATSKADDVAHAGVKISSYADDAGGIHNVSHITDPKILSSKVDDLGSQLHDIWRAPRKLANGKYEPRWKEIPDWDNIPAGAVTRRVDGKLNLDIANTSYKNLHPSWQAENHASAAHAIGVVNDSAKKGVIMGEDFVEEAGKKVHQAWLARPDNAWAKGGDLDVPFASLTKIEAEKDRVIARAAMQILADKTDDVAAAGPRVYTDYVRWM